jgi:tripartite-type tricarboxylate transporter receptor subunit TctC
MTSLRIVQRLLGIAALALAATAAHAEYPDHPVTLIIPPGVGGGTDTLYRALIRSTEPHLGQPIVPLNRPGAGGGLGTGEIARAKPDGYTIGAVLQQVHLGMMMPELNYKAGDFTYLMMVNADPMAFTVRTDSKWKSMKDLIADARANPGKISVGNCGSGCISDIATAMLEQGTNTQFLHVPYNGHAPGRTALLGGHVDVMMLTPAEAVEFVKDGKLRVLAVTDERRSGVLPDVPTVQEAAGFPIYAVGWRAIGGPKGMPADVQAKLIAAFRKGMDEPAFKDFAAKGGFELRYMDAAQLSAFVTKENAEWAKILAKLGLAK